MTVQKPLADAQMDGTIPFHFFRNALNGDSRMGERIALAGLAGE